MRTFLFLFVIIALIVITLVLYGQGIFDRKGSINTQFTPTEIAAMLKMNSVDYIAGECESKDFVLIKEYSSDYKATNYDFFYTGNKNDIEKYGLSEHMKEKISVWDNENTINHVIRDKRKYRQYIDYLRTNNFAKPNTLAPYLHLLSDSTFIFDDCLFTNIGYTIDENGFVINGVSIDNFVSNQKKMEKIRLEKQRQLEENEKAAAVKEATPEPTTSVAYIDVNIADAFSKPNEGYRLNDKHYNYIQLRKGTRLKIRKQESGFYYCDFTDSDGNDNTGWIKDDDITFSKPAN